MSNEQKQKIKQNPDENPCFCQVDTQVRRDYAEYKRGYRQGFEKGFREGEAKQAIIELQARDRFIADLKEKIKCGENI